MRIFYNKYNEDDKSKIISSKIYIKNKNIPENNISPRKLINKSIQEDLVDDKRKAINNIDIVNNCDPKRGNLKIIKLNKKINAINSARSNSPSGDSVNTSNNNSNIKIRDSKISRSPTAKNIVISNNQPNSNVKEKEKITRVNKSPEYKANKVSMQIPIIHKLSKSPTNSNLKKRDKSPSYNYNTNESIRFSNLSKDRSKSKTKEKSASIATDPSSLFKLDMRKEIKPETSLQISLQYDNTSTDHNSNFNNLKNKKKVNSKNSQNTSLNNINNINSMHILNTTKDNKPLENDSIKSLETKDSYVSIMKNKIDTNNTIVINKEKAREKSPKIISKKSAEKIAESIKASNNKELANKYLNKTNSNDDKVVLTADKLKKMKKQKEKIQKEIENKDNNKVIIKLDLSKENTFEDVYNTIKKDNNDSKIRKQNLSKLHALKNLKSSLTKFKEIEEDSVTTRNTINHNSTTTGSNVYVNSPKNLEIDTNNDDVIKNSPSSNANHQNFNSFSYSLNNYNNSNCKNSLDIIKESASNEEETDRFSFQRRNTPKFDVLENKKRRSNSFDRGGYSSNEENTRPSFNMVPVKKV